MSLSSELCKPTPLRDQLRRFPKPALPRPSPALRVTSRSHRPSYMGTGYDYLLRFLLARTYPQAVTRSWVADAALERVRADGEAGALYPFKARYQSSGKTAGYIDRLLRRTRREVNEWQQDAVSRRLARLALKVGQCDYLVRCFSAPLDFGWVYGSEVRELCELIAATDLKLFAPSEQCWLNPHFGCGSYALYGADCDLIIDRRLIEIKTSARRVFPALSWHQLLGYAALSRFCPLNGGDTLVPVNEVGIYFARYNELVTWKLSDVIEPAEFDRFLQWFRACLAASEKLRLSQDAKWERRRRIETQVGSTASQSEAKNRPRRQPAHRSGRARSRRRSQ